MKKNHFISKKTATVFWALTLFLLLGIYNSASADVRYGLSVNDPIYTNTSGHGELKCSGESPINGFQNIDALCSGARIFGRSSLLLIQAELTVPTTGWYQIFRASSPSSGRLEIRRENWTTLCSTFSATCPDLMWLTAGETYRLYIRNEISSWAVSPFLQLFWRPNITDTSNPEATPSEWIPNSNLSAKIFGNTEISIPDGHEEQMNYLISGVGTYDNTGSAEIQMQLPPGFGNDDIMKDDVYLFWQHNGNANITVNGTPITGQWIRSSSANNIRTSGWLWEKIPALAVSADPGGKINFSFTGLSLTRHPDGISVLVPFKDTSKSLGQLKLKLQGFSAQHLASYPITFDVNSRDLSELRPFLIVTGSDIWRYTPTEFRSTYLSYLSGNGSKPSDNDFFGMSEMLVPKNPAPLSDLDPANKDSWYPAFSREGNQLDILAKAENYAQNLATGAGYGPTLDHLPVPAPGTEWISFQSNSSNYPQNATSSPASTNESTGIIVAGLMTYSTTPPPPTPKLLICPSSTLSLPFTLIQGTTRDLQAFYWASYSGTPTCTPADLAMAVDVTNDPATTWSANNTNVSLPAKGTVRGQSAGTSEVTATYQASLFDKAYFQVPPPIDGICGPICHQSSCEQPTTGFCQSPSAMEAGTFQSTLFGWNWVCEGVGGSSTNCNVVKNCGWVEK